MDSLHVVGEVPRDGAKTVEDPTKRLALRPAPLLLSVGELVVEERLEIRGILVGVSFGRLDDTFREEEGGGSLASFPVC